MPSPTDPQLARDANLRVLIAVRGLLDQAEKLRRDYDAMIALAETEARTPRPSRVARTRPRRQERADRA